MPVGIQDYYNYNSAATGPGRSASSTSRASESETEDSQDKTDATTGSNGSNGTIDAVFGDPKDKQVSMEDFLTLMMAQLKNQDFMNPVDDTQYVTQLAQISSMQQMEDMAYNAKSTYIASLVGKTVVAAKFTVSGDLKKTEGIVDKISLLDGKFVVFVDGEAYNMDEIMEIKTAAAAKPEDPKPEDPKPEDPKPEGPGTEGGESTGGGKTP